ncbi:MAG: hypothetical protein KH349_00145 [Clostridium sp.]|nr:hypothetical protein [Clostridium sp.]
MLTLLKNIERFNKRYNKKRGSAMLMVLMTMAIIIVVGTSMLFVTLSSFSNSIADTQQERAYNAALTVSDTLKGSTQLNTIIETYFTKIKENGSAEVQFYNDTDFDNQAVNYTIVNGVKVYVTLSKSPSSSANKIDKVLVDIKGVKGSQESTVSFEADSVPDGTSTTIQDTFGNSFVVSNNMGSSVTSPYQIYKRIEGDVSINCFETENGERVMKTRIFNPVVLEGVTGSVYANGDLIIGAPDNMLRVQGNVYVDGNLTIRGLALGVNLPALTKKYYAKKYLYYYTYAYGEFGSIAVPPNNKAGYKNSSTTKLGEAMYEKLSDGTYRPIQTYDKLSHFTLMDLAGDANEYTFWTKNYGENNTTGSYTWEQVTITLRVKDKNGIWQNIDAEYNQGGINNAQYLGASMYSDTEGDGTPIMQYPQGGNIYCSGDIIFDTVNVGNVFSFDAGVFNTGSTDAGHEDQDEKPDPSALDKINKWLSEHLGIDLINPRFPYYSYAYNLDGTGDGTIPVHTKIEGDVFCQGRMIIAPETQKSYINYKDEQWLGIASDLSDTKKYIGGKVVASDDFVLKDSGAFLSQIKDKWQQVTGKKWGDAFDFGTVKLDVTLNRFYTNELVDDDDNTLAEYSGNMASFIEAYKKAYGKEKLSNSESIKRLKEKFEELGKDGYSYLLGNDYTQFGNGNNLNGAKIKEKDKTKWYDFRKPEFSETSNLYIQNSPIRKGTSCGDIEHKNSNGVDPCTLEKYASDDKYRVVENIDEKDEYGKPVTTRTKVGGISYTAALSVRYCEITVNNVYCDGTISVLESKLPGFENSAAVNVKNNYFGSDFVKNELKKASIMDFLKYVLQKNNAQLTDEEILKEYFGVDKNKNEFKGETNFVFNVLDDNKFTYKEEFKKNDITHNRKVVVIRAHYEMTVQWKNDERWRWVDIGHHENGEWISRGWHQTNPINWYKDNPAYEGKFVADLMYCIEDTVENPPEKYENKKNATDKIVKSDGTIVERKDWGSLGLNDNESALVEYLYSTKDLKENEAQYKYALSLVKDAFIDFEETPAGYASFKDYFVAKNQDSFYISIDDPRDVTNQEEVKYVKGTIKWGGSYWDHDYTDENGNKQWWYVSASATARYDFTLKPFANITGGSELAGLDKLSYVLSGADILASAFLNTDYLITMFSNGANDFDGIDLNALLGAAANGLVGSAIIGGKLKTFGVGSTSNQFDAMKGTTKAFNEGLYGMYLAVDNRYSLVDNAATVKAIFEEIKSPEFATVVEANANQKQAKENVKKILNDLKEKGDIEEYNAFDIYGSINEYDRYSGITSGKNVKDYICANNDKLTKKYVRSSFKKPDINNVMTYLQTLTFPDSDPEKWWNIERWYFVEHSDKVEDDSGLRLMDFYNTKAKENGAHLRADSTFAIDEKYNQTFTGLKDKELDGFDRVAVRSEVQYTIKQNTYFNFALSNTQVVFAASTDGVDKRVRMNFLIDTSEKDIYVFFHCKALDKSKDKKEQTRFLFQKCSFQVTGKNNAYLMLVDDTSFAANAYSLEISNTMLSEDKTDEKVGTHFKSNTYQKYVARFKEHGGTVSAFNLVALTNAIQMQALPEGDPAKVGNMFIIGMGRNYVKFGRGGSVNAMVYIPNGMYSNESSGLFNSIPIGNSGNNEASIVAKDIYIGGSSRGQLIFSSYDAAKIGSKNNNSSGLVMDGLINPDTVSHDTKWVAGDYYYG